MGRTVEKGLLVCVGLLLSSCGEQPSISVTSPNGGETWAAGATATVTWSTTGTVGNVMIQLSTDGGGFWTTLLSSTANDGTEQVTVPDSPSAQCRVRVAEDDGSLSDASDGDFTIAPPLTVTLPASATEGDGVLADAGTVSVPAIVGSDLAVSLSSDDMTEVTVLSSATISAGTSSTTFDLTIANDAVLDLDQQATVTASATGFADGTDTITVHDDEAAVLTLDVTPDAAMEGDGVLAGVGTVSVPANVESHLAVSLSSDDTTEVTVPSSVTISAGTSSASFDVTIGNDAVRDGDKVVTVTASAAGYVSSSDTMTVKDDEFTVWYVDIDATGASDGTSWANAFLHPQDAMDAAVSRDEVWVAEGTYTQQGSDTVILTMKNGVSVYGGFAGTETSRGERDPATYVTTLDGENVCYHGVLGASDATLDGFAITRGNAPSSPDHRGGGMYNDSVTNLTVANCSFSDNWAFYRGGGMSNLSSSPTVADCVFSDNRTGNWNGGGMSNESSSPTVSGCAFISNQAGNVGGGMYNDQDSSPTLTNCLFWRNMAWDGAGMRNTSSSPSLVNCIFNGNTATTEGGAMYNYNSYPPVTNCIFWGNSAPTGAEIHNSSAVPDVSCSDIQGCGGSSSWDWSIGNNGGGNIDDDPLFVDAANGELHLQPGSPCIDAADGTAAPATDIEGSARYDDPASPNTGVGPPWADMGAYEYQ